MPHYVYLYRDKDRKPRYVGYGKNVTRATSHLKKTHNVNLDALVQAKKFTIEVAGPFKRKTIGLLIETTLLSALQPTFNVVKGPSEDRFPTSASKPNQLEL